MFLTFLIDLHKIVAILFNRHKINEHRQPSIDHLLRESRIRPDFRLSLNLSLRIDNVNPYNLPLK